MTDKSGRHEAPGWFVIMFTIVCAIICLLGVCGVVAWIVEALS